MMTDGERRSIGDTPEHKTTIKTESCCLPSKLNAGHMKHKIRIHSTPEACQHVVTDILSMVELFGFSKTDCDAIRNALDEALANAMMHGNRGYRTRSIVIQYAVTSRCTRIRITDEGQGFDPAKLEDPTSESYMETPGGRGVFLIQTLMDQVRYNPRGNSVEFVKRNKIGKDAVT